MKCPNCGKEIAEDSQFCEYCGVKINPIDVSTANKPKVKWGQLILGIIGVIIGGLGLLHSAGLVGMLSFFCIMGIIVFLAYMRKKNK